MAFLEKTIAQVKSWLGMDPVPENTFVPAAREISRGEYDDLKGREEILSDRLGVPAPRLVVVDRDDPNANYNPSDDTLRIHRGSLEQFTKREQDSEIAHELGHARDVRERPWNVPRRDREFRADLLAVAATGDPDARISGLRKIEDTAEHDRGAMQSKIADERGPESAMAYGALPGFAQTFIQGSSFHWRQLMRRLHRDTHPLAEERYQRLEAMKEQMADASLQQR